MDFVVMRMCVYDPRVGWYLSSSIWLRGFCIANLTSEINCHFKKVFDKFDSQNKLVQKR